MSAAVIVVTPFECAGEGSLEVITRWPRLRPAYTPVTNAATALHHLQKLNPCQHDPWRRAGSWSRLLAFSTSEVSSAAGRTMPTPSSVAVGLGA